MEAVRVVSELVLILVCRCCIFRNSKIFGAALRSFDLGLG